MIKPRDLSMLKTVAGVIRDHVGQAFDSLKDQIDSLSGEIAEVRQLAAARPDKGDKGDDGHSVTLEQVLPELKEAAIDEVAEFLANLKPPKDGKDGHSVTLDDIQPLIESKQNLWALDFERRAQDLLQRAIERIPTPKDGEDGKDAEPDVIAARVIDRLDLRGSTKADISKLCKELVAAEVARIPPPKDGNDAEPVTDSQIASAVHGYIRANPPRDGEDGESVTVEQVLPALKDHASSLVAEFLSQVKMPKDGTSVTVSDVLPGLKEYATEYLADAVAKIVKPKDGKDADPPSEAMIASAVEKHLSANPPKDGEPGKDADPPSEEMVAAAVAKHFAANPLKDGEDGKDADPITDEQIEAIVEKRLAARQAMWELDFYKHADGVLQKAIDRMEKPQDGRDGFSLDSFDVRTDDGGRTWILSFDDGVRKVERKLVTTMPKYRELWQKDTQYDPGDMVTWGGSIWAAVKKTKTQPNGYNKDWRLSVKRGKNGFSEQKA